MCDEKREMTKEEMIAEINRLIDENATLRVKLEEVYESVGIKKVENAEKYRIEELEALCKDLQDQHQQDCVRYNDIRTAFLKTVDELATLRKQFGVVLSGKLNDVPSGRLFRADLGFLQMCQSL